MSHFIKTKPELVSHIEHLTLGLNFAAVEDQTREVLARMPMLRKLDISGTGLFHASWFNVLHRESSTLLLDHALLTNIVAFADLHTLSVNGTDLQVNSSAPQPSLRHLTIINQTQEPAGNLLDSFPSLISLETDNLHLLFRTPTSSDFHLTTQSCSRLRNLSLDYVDSTQGNDVLLSELLPHLTTLRSLRLVHYFYESNNLELYARLPSTLM